MNRRPGWRAFAAVAIGCAGSGWGIAGGGFVDPIAATAHGAAWGPQGERIVADAAFIAGALEAYSARALETAAPKERWRHDARRRYLEALAGPSGGGVQQTLYERTLLLQALLAPARTPEAQRLAQRAALLQRWVREGMGEATATRWTPPPHLVASYAQIGLAAAAPAAPPAAVIQARETYAKQCAKRGVPVPPPWGDAAWKSEGRVDAPFIITGKKAEVYAYRSTKPAGLCLALPRYVAGDTESTTFGIICMGKAVGTPAAVGACFWDNQYLNAEVAIPLAPAKPLPLLIGWEAGTRLEDVGGKCTGCHAGENAFVVHPEETPFANLAAALKPDGYYKPHIRADWPQNERPTALLGAVPAGESRCTDCHSAASGRRLPDIVEGLAKPPGSNYCEQVLETAIDRRTMPDVGVGADPGYATHAKILRDACAKAAK